MSSVALSIDIIIKQIYSCEAVPLILWKAC